MGPDNAEHGTKAGEMPSEEGAGAHRAEVHARIEREVGALPEGAVSAVPDLEVECVSQREHERAIELAYRAVGYRERTVAELRTFLERKRVGPCAIDEAVAELCEAGFLDDARYARRFAEDKRELERWGAERIARDLHRRGVPPDLIEAAVANRSRDSELSAALLVLEGRLTPPQDDRERDRAWRLLVRRGYETEIAYEAVRRYERDAGHGRHAA
jgi:regulatory protein